MGALEVSLILFGLFGLLLVLRVPVAFALGLACIPVFFIDERLNLLECEPDAFHRVGQGVGAAGVLATCAETSVSAIAPAAIPLPARRTNSRRSMTDLL